MIKVKTRTFEYKHHPIEPIQKLLNRLSGFRYDSDGTNTAGTAADSVRHALEPSAHVSDPRVDYRTAFSLYMNNNVVGAWTIVNEFMTMHRFDLPPKLQTLIFGFPFERAHSTEVSLTREHLAMCLLFTAIRWATDSDKEKALNILKALLEVVEDSSVKRMIEINQALINGEEIDSFTKSSEFDITATGMMRDLSASNRLIQSVDTGEFDMELLAQFDSGNDLNFSSPNSVEDFEFLKLACWLQSEVLAGQAISELQSRVSEMLNVRDSVDGRKLLRLGMLLGSAYYESDRWDELGSLLRELSAVLEGRESRRILHINFGHFSMASGRFAEAVSHYEAAGSDGGVPAMVTANHCAALILCDRNEEAETMMAQLMGDGRLQVVNLLVGQLYCARNQWEFGLTRIMDAAVIGEVDAETWFVVKQAVLGFVLGLAESRIDRDGFEDLDFLATVGRFLSSVSGDVSESNQPIEFEAAYLKSLLERLDVKSAFDLTAVSSTPNSLP